MITVHAGAGGTKSSQVYGSARIRDKSVKVYVGPFATERDAEAADDEHRVTQRGIKAGDRPVAVDQKRMLGDAFDAWLRAIKDQRSHDEYEGQMRLYVRPTFDRTPLVKVTKAKLIDLRTSLKEREVPIGNATINTLFASLSAAYSCSIEHDPRHTFAGLFLVSGGDIFKLSKIVGRSSVAITQQLYALLRMDAFAEDYSHVALAMHEKELRCRSAQDIGRLDDNQT